MTSPTKEAPPLDTPVTRMFLVFLERSPKLATDYLWRNIVIGVVAQEEFEACMSAFHQDGFMTGFREFLDKSKVL